jgi:hypothetical protein
LLQRVGSKGAVGQSIVYGAVGRDGFVISGHQPTSAIIQTQLILRQISCVQFISNPPYKGGNRFSPLGKEGEIFNINKCVCINFSENPPERGKGKDHPMLEAKDFAAGCLTIILCAILIPLFFLVFKLTLLLAVFLAIVIGIILGVTVLGRVVRLFITGK